MSKFFSSKYSNLEAYVPGEQPRDQKYIKLNTNESPFPPCPKAMEILSGEIGKLQLYPDPNLTDFTASIAEYYKLKKSQVIVSNGSDEVLNFCFMAYGDSKNGFAFPDISYGFYKVFAEVNSVPYKEIPLTDDFRINVDDYLNLDMNIVIANPNAPTGICLSIDDVEKIVSTNLNHIVVIDEAYVDFGGESSISLINKYENLIVTQTFSKSRSLAGGRIGLGFACEEIINDLNTIKYSTNPYNVNRMSAIVGMASINDEEYFKSCVSTVVETRNVTMKKLQDRGFQLTDTKTNFIFAKPSFCSGDELYTELKKKGILIRHWDSQRIKEWCRISVGSSDDMNNLIDAIDELIAERK